MKMFMHFQMAAMCTLKGTIKCNVTNHGIALNIQTMEQIICKSFIIACLKNIIN